MATTVELRLQTQIGRRIRAARSALGVSAEHLGHQVGLDRTYITSVERGERNVGILNLVRIATALGENPATFVDGLRLSRKIR